MLFVLLIFQLTKILNANDTDSNVIFIESSTSLNPKSESMATTKSIGIFEGEIKAAIKELHCPSAENAVSTCPSETNYVYYICCGGAHMYCCEHIQTWLIATISIGAAIFTCLLFICLLRYCCSYREP